MAYVFAVNGGRVRWSEVNDMLDSGELMPRAGIEHERNPFERGERSELASER
jgi:hypothetical protein